MAWPRLSGLRSEAATGRPFRAHSKPSVQPHSPTPHGWHHDMRCGERKNSSCPLPEETPDSCRPLKEESGEKTGWGKKTSERGREKKPSARVWQVWWFCSVITALPVWTFSGESGRDYVALGLSSLSILTHVWFPWQLFLSFSTLYDSYLSLQNHPSLVIEWMHSDRRSSL